MPEINVYNRVNCPDCDINIEMIDVCYNLFMILMGVDSTYWATRAATTTGGSREGTLTRLQTVNTLETPESRQASETEIWSETEILHHHKPILFHPSSSAIDFLAPAYIK